MFFHKKEEKKKPCPDPMVRYATCASCKGLFDKYNMQKMPSNYYGGFNYFCDAHRKLYDRVSFRRSYYNGEEIKLDVYYKELEVDVNGVPVGYIKVEENNGNNS